MIIKLADTVRFCFGTSDAAGVATDADSTPSVVVLEQGTALGYSPTVTNIATGLYEVAIECSGANGFDAEKEYSAYAEAIVGGDTGRDGIGSWRVVAEDLADVLARVTSVRAGYLDNLNVGGALASSAEVLAIQNNTRVSRSVPDRIAIPNAGSRTYRVEIMLYDDAGNMEAPDSAPTIALVNQAGTSRTSRLDSTTMALIAPGHYRSIYTSTAGDAVEQLLWTFSVLEGAVTRLYPAASSVEAEASSAPSVNVTQWNGTAVAAPTVAGIPKVELASMATDAISAAGVSAAAVTKIATGIWAAVSEGSATYGDSIRYLAGVVGGKVQNFLTGTLVFKSPFNPAKTRATVTCDETGRLSSTPGDLTP